MNKPLLLHGDCLEKLKRLLPCSVDSIVTDPPYGLSFMGKSWDYDVPKSEIWREALRVLKPGGHLLAFFGTRTYHRGVVNIEDAGFEIRDQIGWCFGSGFPKSHNLKGDWQGWGSALKPAWESIVVARKPLEKGLTIAENVIKWGCGALNIDESRIYVDPNDPNHRKSTGGYVQTNSEATIPNAPFNKTRDANLSEGRWPANIMFDEFQEQVLTLKNSLDCGIREAIEVYYASYGPLQNLQKENVSSTEQKESNEVLLKEMLSQGSENKTCTHDGKEALNSINQKDAREASKDGQTTPDMERLLLLEGLQAHKHNQPTRKTKTDIKSDASEGSRDNTGAPFENGNQVRSATEPNRSCASQKRNQRRQSDSESRIERHESSQERTLGSFERGEKASCLVRESDVPQVWLQYFKNSGFTVRSGAAAVLDEQSGVLKNGGQNKTSIKGKGMFLGDGGSSGTSNFAGDSGGASRFFYVAKASKSERNKGLDRYEIVSAEHTVCKDVLTVAVQLLQKVIYVDTAQSKNALSWNIGESGNHISVVFPTECRSTMLTEISKTIELKILNLLTHSLTNENTQIASSLKVNGLSLVVIVASLKKYLLNITNEKMELALGAVNAASKTLQSISENEEPKTFSNVHATVKPIKLMQYLIKLVTPPNGTVLDPFMGSGSTGVAAKSLGFNFIGCEMNEEYLEIAQKRIDQ